MKTRIIQEFSLTTSSITLDSNVSFLPILKTSKPREVIGLPISLRISAQTHSKRVTYVLCTTASDYGNVIYCGKKWPLTSVGETTSHLASYLL